MMLRSLLFMLAVIVSGFYFLGDLSSSGQRDPFTHKIYDTAFGKLYTKTRNLHLLEAAQSADQADAVRPAAVTLAWPAGHWGASYAERKGRLEKRSASYGDAECRLLLATLASQCRVSSTTAELSGDGAYLKLNLDFIPSHAIGAIPASADLQLDEIDLDYRNFDASKLRNSDAGASDRRALYAEIGRDCEETRKIYGNCLLAVLRLRTDLFGTKGDHFIGLSANADIGIVRRRTFSQ